MLHIFFRFYVGSHNESLLLNKIWFFLEIDKVTVGGSEDVLLSQEDYEHATAASKPTMMALRFVAKLFTKDILRCSTLSGTKEFASLDPKIIAAIKSK